MKKWEQSYIQTVPDIGTIYTWLESFALRSLFPREKVPYTHWIGCWMGPTASLVAAEETKIVSLAENRTLAVQPVACYYTDWTIEEILTGNVSKETMKRGYKLSYNKTEPLHEWNWY